MKEQVEAKSLREGRYVLIDDEPCRIVNIDVSKPGKHGAAKMRIEAVGVFDQAKRSMISPTSEKVYIPMIGRKRAQVVSMHGDTAQLMDMDTYETYDMVVPQEYQGQLEAGKEIEVLEAMGRRMISRV